MYDHLLVFIACQCRGIKFYTLGSVEVNYGTRAVLNRVENAYDSNCIGVFVPDNSLQLLKIGHVSAEVANYLHPILTSYRITW